MRRHYSNVVATIALVFAMSGGAVAANHYLLTSTKQIKPSVLKALRTPGAVGPKGLNGGAGPTGAQGATGTPGATGAQGQPGPVTVDQAKSAYVIRRTDTWKVDALCHEGDIATGGHAQFDPVAPETEALKKRHEEKVEGFFTLNEGGSANPVNPPTGYYGELGQVKGEAPSGQITVEASCLRVAP